MLALETGVSPSRAFINVDFPQPTGPCTKIMSPELMVKFKLRRTGGLPSSQPNVPPRTEIQALWLLNSAPDASELDADFSISAGRRTTSSRLVRVSTRGGVRRNCSNLVRHPRAVMNSINPANRLNRGSAMSRSKDSEVNTRAGSKLVALLRAIAVKMANVRTGDISCGT